MDKKGKHKKASTKGKGSSIYQLYSNGVPVTLYPDIVILYRFMPLDAFEATIKSWSLKATLSYEANDPFEFMPQSVKAGVPADFRANSPLSSPPPFICFSRTITKASMWGLYADSGRGVCLVFGLPVTEVRWKHEQRAKDRLCIDGKKYAAGKSIHVNAMNASLLLPVQYSELRVNPPEKLDCIGEIGQSVEDWFLDLISSKDKTWENEDEVRLVCDYKYASTADSGKVCFSWPMNYLLGAVVGPRCAYSPAIIRKLLQDAYAKHGDKQNYFHSHKGGAQCDLIDGFIVSQAYYHWQRYEMECIPWGDRINGEEFVQLIAMACCKMTNSPLKTMSAKDEHTEETDLSVPWRDICNEVYKKDGETILLIRPPLPTAQFIRSPITSLAEGSVGCGGRYYR